MKMTVFWEEAPCSLIEIDGHFMGSHRGDGGSKLLRNVGQLLADYMAQNSRRNLHIRRHENVNSCKGKSCRLTYVQFLCKVLFTF
jgi:hypothetical protein